MNDSHYIISSEAQRDWGLWHLKPSEVFPLHIKESPTPEELLASTNQNKTIFGLPVEHCRTLAFSVPVVEDELIDELIDTQLELKGLNRTSEESGGYRKHIIFREAEKTLVSVDLFNEIPEEFLVGHASDYLASARLFKYPDHKVVIMPQFGRLVLAVGAHNQLVHCHALSHGLELTDQISHEIGLTILSLEASNVISEIDGIEIWGDFPQEDIIAFSEKTALPVNQKPLPNISPSDQIFASPAFVPRIVEKQQNQKDLLKKILLGSLIAFLAYSAGVAFLWHQSYQAKNKLNHLSLEESALVPRVDKVNTNIQKWNSFQPILDTKRYPMVVLNELTKLFTPTGNALAEYNQTTLEVHIKGRTKDSKTAHEFLEKIKQTETLDIYNWEMGSGSPRQEADNTAKYQINGRIEE